MSFLLRLTGTTNAAVWFGAGVFILVGLWPAFASGEMLKFLPALHAEAAAHVTLERFYTLQYWCGAVAVGHLLGEWIYAGRPLQRWVLLLVTGLLMLTLFSGLSAGPRVKQLHLEKYGVRSTPQQREMAHEGLNFWRKIAVATHVIEVLGLWLYVAEMMTPGAGARLLTGKFRG